MFKFKAMDTCCRPPPLYSFLHAFGSSRICNNMDLSVPLKPAGLLAAVPVALPKGLAEKLLRFSQTAFYIPVEITNHKFTAAMLNTESNEFKDMYKDVTTLVRLIASRRAKLNGRCWASRT